MQWKIWIFLLKLCRKQNFTFMWKERLNRNLSSGFEQLSLDPRLHGNDYRGYEVLKMITVGARRAVPLQMMWTVSPNSVLGKLRICSGFVPFAREWQSRLWSFENDNRRGKARRAPTNDVNGIPELRFGQITHVQRFCSVCTGMTIGALILLRSLSSFEMTNIEFRSFYAAIIAYSLSKRHQPHRFTRSWEEGGPVNFHY